MAAKTKRAVRVGLFIFTGLLLFTIGVLAIGNINNTFTKSIQIKTVFDNVNGLKPGNNIWFSGVKIGTVKDMNFTGTSQVEVTMSIEQKSQKFIRKDAKVKISTDGFIGNKIIVITGGSPESEPVVQNDRLTVLKTLSTEDMLNTLQQNNINLLAITSDFKSVSKKIAEGNGNVGKFFSDESLYDELNTTFTSLKQSSQNIENITNSVNEFSSKLNTEGGLANDIATDTSIFAGIKILLSQLQTIAETATEITANLKQTTKELNTNTNSPAGVLLHDEKTAATMKATIDNLQVTSQKLNETLDALQHSILLRGYFKDK